VSALLAHLWQSTLFGLVIWSISTCMRGNSAAVRHGLWLAASLKFLVPFSALYWLGTAAGIPPPVESQPAFFLGMFEAATPVLSPVLALDPSPDGLPAWLPVTGCLWLIGAVLLAVNWVRDWRAARELARAARTLADDTDHVLVTDAVTEPSVARVFAPVVLLPASLLAVLRPARLDAVLAHEHEHIARHDVLKSHLHRLVTTLFWFHPLVWLIGRRLEEERERACDEAVLARGHEPAEYAAGILDVCRHCAGAPTAASVSALAGNLPGRIAQILDARQPAGLGFFKAFALSFAAFLLAVVPLVAGAMDRAERHRERVRFDARLLLDAAVEVRAAKEPRGRARLVATATEVNVHGSSLRELIALAYGVVPAEVMGRDWLDQPRYDIRVRLPANVAEPGRFEPEALRGLVTQVLALRFNIEIHVNHSCQQPCGPRALTAQAR
jgi:beta-lactamase regulating signal transducer with metallopeptidase domain